MAGSGSLISLAAVWGEMVDHNDTKASKERRRSRPSWRLRLYVAGQTPRSLTAYANLKRICETHLKGKYKIEVIDLLSHPEFANSDQIVAVPSLVRQLPTPVRRIVGDLASEARVLSGLEIPPAIASALRSMNAG
jgi:circadian clock protein KaiB